MAALGSAMLSLNASAELDLRAKAAIDVNMWLAGRGLPSAPWNPNPGWLALQLPKVALSAQALATISAFAQLRAAALATLGLDLNNPASATAFARLVATLSARLSAGAGLPSFGMGAGLPSFDAGGWLQLSATLKAIASIQEALSAGLLPSPPSLPLGPWRPFLLNLSGLAPLISASSQLGLNLSASFAAELSAALKAMLAIQMPAMSSAALTIAANLTGALDAVAHIGATLGISPMKLGLPAVSAMVSARLQATAQMVQSGLGLSLSALLALLLRLPSIAFSPASLATDAVVSAAMSINTSAIASMNWNVPVAVSVPVLRVGLPTISLLAQLKSALGLSASTGPCAVCDAQTLLSAGLASAAAG